MKVGVVGASGYAGAELLRLLAGHPELEVAVAQADSSAGSGITELYPGLVASYRDLVLDGIDAAALDGLDVVFLCLPSGRAHRLVPEIADRVGHVVDLSADFRLRDPQAYPAWYGFEHASPDLLGSFAYGLPELERAGLTGAPLVAAPGCYVTAAALALAPLVRSGIVRRTGIVVDAASGVSGAGRHPKPETHFPAVQESFVAYGLLTHRHTPEIEQAVGAQVLFTPHLAPMTRGILATCYAPAVAAAQSGLSTEAVLTVLREAYAGESFVRVVEHPPSTRETLGSNNCHVTARYDARTGYVVALSALDNLVKGAAGQALQAANLALGLPETFGLPTVALTP